jgi:hypothetical protein
MDLNELQCLSDEGIAAKHEEEILLLQALGDLISEFEQKYMGLGAFLLDFLRGYWAI